MEAAGDHHQRAVHPATPVADAAEHVGFAGQGALGGEHVVLVVQPRHGAPGEGVVEQPLPVGQRRAGAQFEQVLPEFVVVPAVGFAGQGGEVAAVGQVALGHQAALLVGGLLLVVLAGPGQVDEGQLRPQALAVLQGLPFR